MLAEDIFSSRRQLRVEGMWQRKDWRVHERGGSAVEDAGDGDRRRRFEVEVLCD
jgi:hypothetical protein